LLPKLKRAMVSPDLQKVIGSDIICKATHVIALTECYRRYGAHAKTKVLDGGVQNVIIDKSNPTSRVQTYIEAEFDLGNGRSKVIKVHLRYVQLKDKESSVLPPTEAQVVQPTEHLAEAEVVEPILTVTKENNEISIEMVQQAANDAINEIMGPISESAKDAIAKYNELIAIIDSC
jgi:hypothetical protein